MQTSGNNAPKTMVPKDLVARDANACHHPKLNETPPLFCAPRSGSSLRLRRRNPLCEAPAIFRLKGLLIPGRALLAWRSNRPGGRNGRERSPIPRNLNPPVIPNPFATFANGVRDLLLPLTTVVIPKRVP